MVVDGDIDLDGNGVRGRSRRAAGTSMLTHTVAVQVNVHVYDHVSGYVRGSTGARK